ncbi:Ig-like domain-containing protein [Methylobacterium sp. ID0610]|uniref:Ig-like domain-containing protein n=1 Tax=Methylobacterium carpenticola TaxID=3344827 RepID=UPI00368A15C6
MAAGGTLTLSTGSDYVFSSTEVWSGIVGNGTRGVTLNTRGSTLTVTQLDHITGARSITSKEVVTLLPSNGGSTISVSFLETMYGSGGRDVVQIASTGSTMAVEGIETVLGATTGTGLIALTSTAGNTMSVGYLKSIIGGAGKDVITFGAAGEIGTTTAVSFVETLIGTAGGMDLIATNASGSNTVSLTGIEIFLGNAGTSFSDVLTLAGGGTIGVAFVETVIGSAARDVAALGWKAGSANVASGGGTVAVSSIEMIVGGTSSRNTAILLDQGNTVTVGSLNTLIGGGGNDVVQLTMLDGTPIVGTGPIPWNTAGNTMLVSLIETIIGTSGQDAIVSLNNGGGTLSVSAVETLVGRVGTEVFLLDMGGNTVAVEAVETLIGGSGTDVIGLTAAASARGTTMQVAGIETLAGGAGTDVVLLDAGGNTVAVEAVETLIGGAGTDVVILTEAAGTIFVSDVETLYVAQTGQTLDVTGQSRQVVFPFSATAPAAPSAPSLASASDTGVQGDLRTGTAVPTLTGTAAAGSVINLYGAPPSGATVLALGSGTADAAGLWSITTGTALADGAWTLMARSVASGTESAASAFLFLTIDTTAPAAPTLGLAPGSDTGASTTDGLTNVVQPTLTGSAEAGSTVTLYDGALAIGTATANGAGVWSIAAAQPLTEGTYTFTARAMDAAGNTGTASSQLEVTIDTSLAAPTLALDLASDTGIAGDDLTAVNAPVIAGSAEAFAVVSLIENGALLGSASADASGQWQLTLGTLSEGAHTLSARAVDRAGNTSVPSGSLTVTIDTTPPTAPSAPTLAPASDTGTSNSDQITRVAAPTFTGSAEAGSTIDLLVGGSLVGAGTADGAGLWTITSSTLGEGTHTVSARARDAAGNTRDGSGLTVTIDLTSPPAPTGLALTAASDTGDPGDGITRLSTPAIRGLAEAGDRVRLYEGQTLLGTGTADGQGAWTVSSSVLTGGGHSLTAVAVDPAGNTSAASAELAITLDLVAPAAPSGLALDGGSDSGTAGDGVTNRTAPVITGSAESGSRIDLYDGTALVGTGTADAVSGLWSVQAANTLIDGPHTLTAVAADRAGNTGAASAGFVVTIDTTAPAIGTPTADADGVAPTVSGTAEAGSLVTLYGSPSGGAVLGTATAGSAGAWSIKTPDLAPATYTLVAQAMDAAGNVGSAQITLTLAGRLGIPGGLALAAGSDSGTDPGDRITRVAAPTITGTALADAVITLYDNGTTAVVGTTTADTTGAWAITATALGEGTHVLRAMGLDGTTTLGTSTPLTITIDTTGPDAGGLALQAASDTGASSSDRVTRATTPVVTGTAEAGSLVTLYDSDRTTVVGHATSAADGAWSATATLGAGVHTLTARAVDVAGNTGSASAGLDITVDTDAAAPAILTLADDRGTGGSHLTRQTAPTVTGTAEAGSSVALYAGSQLVGTGSADPASGAWTVGAAALGDGTHTLTAQIVDRAGNTSAASADFVLSVDSTAPGAPTAPAPSADTGTPGDGVTREPVQTFSGTAEAGSLVTLYDNGTALAAVTADATSGAWSIANVTLAAGLHSLTARAADAAGNTGAPSAALALTIDLASDTPSALALAAASDTGLSASDRVTRASTLTLTGSAEGASLVTLYDGGIANPVGTVQADGTGAWSFTLAGATEGAHTFTATAIDPAGNTSAASAALTVTVDRTIAAPSAPALNAGSDSGTLGDRLTNVAAPVVTGTAEAGAAVSLHDGTRLLGIATADGAGAWSLRTPTLTDGVHTLAATAVDLAGNSSTASAGLTLTIDTVNDAPFGAALTAASDTGVPGDGLTRLLLPDIAGQAEALSVVTLYGRGTSLGTATADGAGAFTILGASLGAGDHSLTLRSVDPAGNTSAASAPFTVSVDVSTGQPSLALEPASDTGASNSDRVTAQNRPLLTGTAEAGSTVTVHADGSAVGTAQAGTLGAWTLTTAALTDGARTLTAIAVDRAGNTSVPSADLVVTIDTRADAPALDAAALRSDSGTTGDAITNDSTPTFAGTTEAGGVITLYEGATVRGTATADGAGAWTLTSNPLANGAHTLTAQLVDRAGNTSVASAPLAVTIDTVAPSAATGLALAPGSDVGSSNTDRITRIAMPALIGSAEANGTVTLFDGSTAIGTATAGGTGLFTVAAGTSLTHGQHSLRVTVTDVAGNTGAASNPLSVTIDTVAPVLSPLALTAATDTGVSSTDGITRTVTPTVTGTTEANSTVTLLDGGTAIGTATANGLGVWSTATTALSAGTHTLTAVAVDRAGNTSAASASLTVTIDTDAATPTGLALAVDSGLSSTDRLIDTGTPTLVGQVGTAEAGGLVQLYDGLALVGTGTAGLDGAFTVTSLGLSDGTHALTARLIDLAGNTSIASSVLDVTVDTTAPGAPSALTLAGNSDSGTSGSDRVTAVTTPTVTGSAEAGSRVVLYEGTTSLGIATAGAGGLWTITSGSALSGSADGTVHTLVAVATDAAGNTGTASTGLTLTVDTAAAQPAGLALAAASDSGILGDGITASQRPTVNGLAEAGSVVMLYESAATAAGGIETLLGTAVADGAGFWAITSDRILTGGTGAPHALFATIVDRAGNTSPASASLTITIDTVPDAVTVGLDSGSDTGLVGDRITSHTQPVLTGQAGANRAVTIALATVPVATVTANGSGLWFYTAGPLGTGANTFSVSSDDGAGNIARDGITVTIDTTGDTPSVPMLVTGQDTGRDAGDGRINIAAPMIQGTAEAGAAVTLYDNGTAIGTVTASGLGTWLFTTPNLADGLHTLTASAVDVTGNLSGRSGPLLLDIAIAAAAPTGLALAPASDTGVQDDLRTRSRTPTITGTAQAGDVIALYDGTTIVGAATADAGGAWAAQASRLGEGAHTLTATRVDVYGNTSLASAPLTVTVDTTSPDAPVVTTALTNSTTPTLAGTAEAGSTVTVTVGGASYTTTATGGSWSLDLATAVPVSGALSLDPNGPNAVSATAEDAAGNISAAGTQTLTLDTTNPNAPVVTSAALSNSTTPTLAGTAEAGSTVTVTVAGASYTAIATGGSWSLDLATATPVTGTLSLDPNGPNAVSATARDAAGNVSAAGTQTLTLDTTAPNAPVVTSAALSNSATPTLTGTAEAGSAVTVTVGGASYTAIATGGSWSLDLATAVPVTGTLSLDPNGPNAVSATARDAAGNLSAAGTQTLTLDTTAPTATLLFEDGSIDAVEQRSSAFLIGGAEAGATFTWTITSSGGGQVIGRGVTTAGTTRVSGLDLSSLGDGTLTLALRLTDPAGNASAPVTAATQKLTATVPDPVAPVTGPVTIDGATVNSEVVTGTDGSRVATVTIAATDASRVEDTSSSNPDLADVPVVRETVVDPQTGQSSSVATLTVSVPTGVGVVATGSAERQTASQAQTGLAGLIAAIEARTGQGTASRADLTGGGSGFLAELSSQALLLVRAIDIRAPGLAPGQPVQMRVSGNTLGGTGTGSTMPTALVIDTTAVPGPVTIRLDNIEFVAVVGNATLVGGDGQQIVYGDGNRQYLYLGADDDILHGGGGNDTVASAGGNDTLFGDEGDDSVLGGEGNDSLFGGTGNDTVFGELGDDVLFGQDDDDFIGAGSGNDFASGGYGNDEVHGEDGDDLLFGDEGRDGVYGEAGNDRVYGGTGDDFVSGGEGNDVVFGQDGDDLVRGDAGDDFVSGGYGNDRVDGGLGNDAVYGDDGDDEVTGGEGDDAVYGGTGNDRVSGDAGNDRVLGQQGNDTLFGGGGNDDLSGGEGDDLLFGGAGDDLLFGNAGADTLVGGDGSDIFAFGRGDGADLVRDFVIDGPDADVIAFNNGAFSSFAAVLAASRQDGSDTVIDYGTGDTLTLQNTELRALTAANFTFD